LNELHLAMEALGDAIVFCNASHNGQGIGGIFDEKDPVTGLSYLKQYRKQRYGKRLPINHSQPVADLFISNLIGY